MTPEEFLLWSKDRYATWATESNEVRTQEDLFRICEQFIGDLTEALELAGGHPTPPHPRVRP